MFVTYHPDFLTALTRLHTAYASSIPGECMLSSNQLDHTFSQLGDRAAEDILINVRETEGNPSLPASFAWFPNRNECGRTFMKGPYLSPSNPEFRLILSETIAEAVKRASQFGSTLLEARSHHPERSKALGEAGFTNPGSYERWRLYPLRGAIELSPLPDNGEIRRWKSEADLEILEPMFDLGYSNDWNYVQPDHKSWLEIIRDPGFNSGLYLFAFKTGKPVGYAIGRLIPDPSGGGFRTAYLVSIFVITDAQHGGWGRALLSRWLRACYETGARAVELDVDTTNLAVKHFYRHFNFRHQSTEEVWWYHFHG